MNLGLNGRTYEIKIPGFAQAGMFAFAGWLAYLKVVKGAALSWVWVFAPFWLPMAIIIGIFVVFFILLLIGAVLGAVLES